VEVGNPVKWVMMTCRGTVDVDRGHKAKIVTQVYVYVLIADLGEHGPEKVGYTGTYGRKTGIGRDCRCVEVL